ncbi:MAG: response regulator [Planctomycetaceae bacterium]|nr:response regulator [Planctomycetaceae bacterium]MCA9113316.1 response regulator [Planctomycetaceae bacterium]
MQRETVGRPMELLLVEDSVPAAKIAMGGLKKGKFEHRLTWLRDGVEAVAFLHQEGIFARAPRPDLILLDLGLPGKDGREILTEIKADEHLRDIPVVIMTASTDQTDIVRSENLNVEAYLIKPVDLKKFLKLVRKLKQFWKEDMIVPPSEPLLTMSDPDMSIWPAEIT